MSMKRQLPISLAACLAEFLAMMLFVILGCGSAMGVAGSGPPGGSGGSGPESGGQTTSLIPGWVLMVALVFGLSITLLAYSIGHYSGGHINCAVTFGLVLGGQCSLIQGLGNFFAQMCGSICGASILLAMFPADNDMTHGLGSNSVGPRWHWYNALIAEIVGTFILMTVVLQTAVNPKSVGNRAQACLAIGFSVFVVHAVLIPIDGCSINPTRSFGPALMSLARQEEYASATQAQVPIEVVSVGEAGTNLTIPAVPEKDEGSKGLPQWNDMWIFWVGPLLGAALAAGIYRLLLAADSSDEDCTELTENSASSDE